MTRQEGNEGITRVRRKNGREVCWPFFRYDVMTIYFVLHIQYILSLFLCLLAYERASDGVLFRWRVLTIFLFSREWEGIGRSEMAKWMIVSRY